MAGPVNAAFGLGLHGLARIAGGLIGVGLGIMAVIMVRLYGGDHPSKMHLDAALIKLGF